MASALKNSQRLGNGALAVFKPRYVCRTCKHQLLQREASHVRQQSTLSPQRSMRCMTNRSFEQRRHLFNRPSARPVDASEELEALEGAEREVPQMEPYVEATTWEGLDQLGHEGHWRDLPPDPIDDYEPWLDPTIAAPPQRDQFLALLWAAIVECLAIKQLNGYPSSIFEEGPPLLGAGLASLKIQTSSSGWISHLEDPSGVLSKTTLENSRIHAEEAQEPVQFSLPEIEEQLQNARLNFNRRLTFTILKRFSQLTGHRVSDSILNTVIRKNKSASEFIDLLTHVTKPKPKTFAERLIAKQEKVLDESLLEDPISEENSTVTPTALAETQDNTPRTRTGRPMPKFQPLGPNVTILPRRETKVDRENEVGRWKVIKKELEARGLPIYSHPRLVPQGEKWTKDEGY